MDDDAKTRQMPTDVTGHSNLVLLRRISVARFLAKSVLFFQALIPAFLWVFTVICLFVAFSWFGFFRLVPDWLRLVSGFGFLVAFLVSWLPVFAVRWPNKEAADRHLEDYNQLPHQAVSVQNDVPSSQTAFSLALWRQHQARMAAKIGTLEVGKPSPDIAQHDPYGLRAIPILGLTIAYFFSGSPFAGTIADVFSAHQAPVAATSLRIDAWVTPPSYTATAPIYLSTQDDEASKVIAVPQYSMLSVRISGAGEPAPVTFVSEGRSMVLPEEPQKDDGKSAVTADQNAQQLAKSYQFKIEQSGQLSIDGHVWTMNVEPDQKPTIEFDGNPRKSANGSLEIAFEGTDDYGFAEAHAEIVPVDDNNASVPLYPLPEYKLDLPRRGNQTVKGVTSRNLTEHPMAGTRVRITLVAADGAGQEGRSEPIEMTLPARSFQEPVAASLAEQRQTFALDANKVGRALQISKALTVRPEETIPNKVHFLLLTSARSRLALANSIADLRSTADYFWQVALKIEDGDVSIAEKNLRDAQKALSDALSRNAPDAEIKKLMDELRNAMTAYLDAMQKRMAENPGAKLPNAAQNMLRQKDLKKMLDQLENLARSGSREEAQKLLNEMQRMMNNLQASKPQGNTQRPNNELTKQIDKLGDLLQNQQKLMDETFSMQKQLEDRLQRGDPQNDPSNPLFDEQADPNNPDADNPEAQGQPEDGKTPGSPGSEMTEQQLRDALKGLKSKQDGLSKQLDELTQGLKNLGMKPGKGFGDAKKHMGEASKSLGQAQGDKATDGQGQALQALRDGAKDMMKQMRGQGQGDGQGQAGGNQQGMDPLGRQRAQNGQGVDADVKVPDEIDIQRAREILEAIRKKLEMNPSPELERQYLERLLDMR